jgi:hypothetical protein
MDIHAGRDGPQFVTGGIESFSLVAVHAPGGVTPDHDENENSLRDHRSFDEHRQCAVDESSLLRASCYAVPVAIRHELSVRFLLRRGSLSREA